MEWLPLGAGRQFSGVGEILSANEERGKRALAFQGTSPSDAPASPACLSVSELCAGGPAWLLGCVSPPGKKSLGAPTVCPTCWGPCRGADRADKRNESKEQRDLV